MQIRKYKNKKKYQQMKKFFKSHQKVNILQ